MKETGIIFAQEMVRAYLEGRKTQTRRTRGLEKINGAPGRWIKAISVSHTNLWRFENKEGELLIVKCPYGQIGDRLRVKETWQYQDELREVEEEDLYTWIYYADGSCRLINRRTLELEEEDILTTDSENEMKWRSSRFMPRWASRITLLITGLRPERLQEITPDDAVAEGFGSLHWDCMKSAIDNFKEYWDSLNSKRGYPWASNPFVWRIEFQRQEMP